MFSTQEVLKEAFAAYDGATACSQQESKFWQELGRCELLCNDILASHPDQVVAIHLLGMVYFHAMRYGLSIQHLRRAAEIKPAAEVWCHLGNVYRRAGLQELALQAYQKSMNLREDPEIYGNVAGLWLNNGTPENALHWAEKAIKIDPAQIHAQNNRAIALLELGRYGDGFMAYEVRQQLGDRHDYRDIDGKPQWDGGRVGTLCLIGEQGLGDEILFLTWLKQVRHRADRVVIRCAPRLVELLRASFAHDAGIAIYGDIVEVEAKERIDRYLMVGSLPRIAGPVQPNVYLRAGEPTVGYQAKSGLRVGISWRGGRPDTCRHLRHAPLDYWKQLIARMGIVADVVSLQYGDVGPEADELGVAHQPSLIADLNNLAAAIADCDLVISVCNTTVHMAGAMGVPCWCLVPNKPAWRYGLVGDRMPWYDSVRLYRQPPDNDTPAAWAPVFGDVAADFSAKWPTVKEAA